MPVKEGGLVWAAKKLNSHKKNNIAPRRVIICDRTFLGYSGVNTIPQHIPDALVSVSHSTIHGYYHQCLRCIQGFRAGVAYGTKEFEGYVTQYKSHRRVYLMGEDLLLS